MEKSVRRKSPEKPGEMGRANGAVMSATKTDRKVLWLLLWW